MLQAYFDASQRESGTFCVAGYAFAKEQRRKFDKEWWKLFGQYGGCHMRELTSRNGRFRGISISEKDRLLTAAVKVISRRISYGVVISCDLSEFDALLPKWIQGFEHAFPVCSHLAMVALGEFVAERSDRRIEYFFESGDKYSGAAKRFMDRVNDVPELKAQYRHASHDFIPKSGAISLQAADLLAWEWAKFQDETIDKRVRKMRLSLIALMQKNGDFNSKQYTGWHITGPPLREFLSKVTQLGLLQIEEESR